jgi:hypothetical protein
LPDGFYLTSYTQLCRNGVPPALLSEINAAPQVLVEAHPRFPYDNTVEDHTEFSQEFMICERVVEKSQKRGGGTATRGRKKLTPQVCNIYRLWKLLGPIILRRRKADIGEEIVKKIRHTIRVPMGQQQAGVYEYHLRARYQDKNGQRAIGPQLAAMRVAACAPHSQLLGLVADGRSYASGAATGTYRSTQAYTPKLATCLTLIRDILLQGEQVAVFSALTDPLETVARYLREAGIPAPILNGAAGAVSRGRHSAQFKLGPASMARSHRASGAPVGRLPLLLCNQESCAEGHNWPFANNVIVFGYSWALDKLLQSIDRCHRLNSVKDLNVYTLVCDGTIERRIEQNLGEKDQSSELILDGKLSTHSHDEMSMTELLSIAHNEFDSNAGAKTLPEEILAKDWPALCASLASSFAAWSKPSAPDAIEIAPAISTTPILPICPIPTPELSVPRVPTIHLRLVTAGYRPPQVRLRFLDRLMKLNRHLHEN